MSSQWFVLISGEDVGPFAFAELRRRALKGELSPDTQVRAGNSPEYVAAGSVNGLFDAESATHEAVPPTASELAFSSAVIGVLCLVALHFLAPQWSAVEKLLTIGLGVACGWSALNAAGAPSRERSVGPAMIYGVACLIGLVMWPSPLEAHPVFNTPLTGSPSSRPAVLVTITDESEHFGTAELYLAIRSSRFPGSTSVLLPVNRGDFVGCTKRFIVLPFEVANGDNLVFELLDDDGLSVEQEKLVVEACRTSGFCVAMAASIYRPQVSELIEPVTDRISQLLGTGIIEGLTSTTFQSFGTAEFIAGVDRPTAPHLANRVTLVDEDLYSRGYLQVYFPTDADATNTTALSHGGG